jgi:hypothetical protein
MTPMRTLISRGIVLLLLLLSSLSPAQNTEAPKDLGKLMFAKTAADIVANMQHQSLAGYVVVVIDEKNWAPLLKDGDLSPFLKLKEPKPGLRAAILISNPRISPTFCVFFNDGTAVSLATAQPNAAGKIDPAQVASSQKPVPKEAIRAGKEELFFTEGEISSDDGQPIAAYQINSAGNKTKKQ